MTAIPNGYRRMEGSVRRRLRYVEPVALPDPHEQVRIIVQVRRRPDAPALPDIDDYTRRSLLVPRILRDVFATRYGASEEDLQAVAAFAASNGLVVEESSTSRRIIVLRGALQDAARAFQVGLAIYERHGERYRGQTGYIHVPDHLFGVIEGVFGFDNRRMAKRMSGGGSDLWPDATPYNAARLYDFPLVADAGDQTIAILEFGGGYKVDQTGAAPDVVEYFAQANLSPPRLVSFPVPGGSNAPGDYDDIEVLLDIEVAGAVAPGVGIVVYFAPWTEAGWMEAVSYAVAGVGLPEGWNPPSVISISWGWPELEPTTDPNGMEEAWTADVLKAISTSFHEAAALGVSVLVASGDSGSDAGDGFIATVPYPGSDPWVTSCGGTEIANVNLDSGTFSEELWQDELGVGGGGVSEVFGLPPWQSKAKVPPSLNAGHVGRGVPDIAGYAAGYPIEVDGQRITNVGGTSESTPMYAGLVAVMNTITKIPVGYLNPILYAYGSSEVFRDIDTDQTNPAYSVGPGWDACTGWGSVNGVRLLNVVQTGFISGILWATILS